MKKKPTDLLYCEMAGSGKGGMVERVAILLERRAKGQTLTKREASVVAAAERSLANMLGAPQEGYRPDKPTKPAKPPPLPFSSFAEGLAQLQNRITQRGARPQLRPSADAGAYRPDQAKDASGKRANVARIAAIVKMAKDERAKLKKPRRKKP